MRGTGWADVTEASAAHTGRVFEGVWFPVLFWEWMLSLEGMEDKIGQDS